MLDVVLLWSLSLLKNEFLPLFLNVFQSAVLTGHRRKCNLIL